MPSGLDDKGGWDAVDTCGSVARVVNRNKARGCHETSMQSQLATSRCPNHAPGKRLNAGARVVAMFRFKERVPGPAAVC